MYKTQPTCDVWFKSQTIKPANCWPTVGCLSAEGSCSLQLPKVLVDSVSVHDDCIKIIQHNT